MQSRLARNALPVLMALTAVVLLVLAASGTLHATSRRTVESSPIAAPDQVALNTAPAPSAGVPASSIAPPAVAPGQPSDDAVRLAALQRIAGALDAYRQRTGRYPTTSNNVQTSCVYAKLDQLCQFQDQLGADTLADPRGDKARYGYWYASDGSAYTLYADLDGPVPQENRCGLVDRVLANQTNLYCLSSRPPPTPPPQR